MHEKEILKCRVMVNLVLHPVKAGVRKIGNVYPSLVYIILVGREAEYESTTPRWSHKLAAHKGSSLLFLRFRQMIINFVLKYRRASFFNPFVMEVEGCLIWCPNFKPNRKLLGQLPPEIYPRFKWSWQNVLVQIYNNNYCRKICITFPENEFFVQKLGIYHRVEIQNIKTVIAF